MPPIPQQSLPSRLRAIAATFRLSFGTHGDPRYGGRKNIILPCDFRAGPNSVGMPGADDLSSVIYNNTYRALAQYPEFMSRIGISDILQPLKIFQLIGGFVDV